MNSNEFDFLLEDIRKILLNQEMTKEDLVKHSETIDNVQEGLLYLSTSLRELNDFANSICNGELDSPVPGRHNLLTGSLKELHGVLRHLTWQTQKVAEGDYRQRVNFLGDFSTAFNTMIEQLEEREKQLKENTKAMKQSMGLLKTIMDAHSDWIIVEDSKNGSIIYNNHSDVQTLTDFSVDKLQFVKPMNPTQNDDLPIYYSEATKSYHSLRTYELIWQNTLAKVHYISDVTSEQLLQQNLTEIAYSDPLTGTYNRRYCFYDINNRINQNNEFIMSLIDINDLKYVNDNYGHNEGDYYINKVVECIQNNCDKNDVISRIGGDEFIIVTDKSCSVFQDKMKIIFDSIKESSSIDYMMSISYGIKKIEASNTLSVEQIIDECDKQMYIFKQEYKQKRGGNS